MLSVPAVVGTFGATEFLVAIGLSNRLLQFNRWEAKFKKFPGGV
jgi:hypothetical protein